MILSHNPVLFFILTIKYLNFYSSYTDFFVRTQVADINHIILQFQSFTVKYILKQLYLSIIYGIEARYIKCQLTGSFFTQSRNVDLENVYPERLYIVQKINNSKNDSRD